MLWTGKPELFRFDQMIIAVLPMVLVAFSVLAHNILVTWNAPYLAAVGRWLQFALTALVLVATPVGNIALRMFLALSIGEIVGFAPVVYYAAARLIPGANLAFHIKALVQTILVATVGGGMTWTAFRIVGSADAVRGCIALALSLVAAGAVCASFGFSPSARASFMSTIVRPQLARLGLHQ